MKIKDKSVINIEVVQATESGDITQTQPEIGLTIEVPNTPVGAVEVLLNKKELKYLLALLSA